jgi:hypothetical protein
MAQLTINVGTNANDGTGDDLRTAMQKVNTNFTELYTASPLTSSISIEDNEIRSNVSNANLKLTASGTGVIEFEGIQIRDNHIEATRSNDDLILSASGTGDIIVGAVRVHGTTISADDSSKITFTESVDITGTLTVPTVDTNILQSTDSSAIQLQDSLNISGNLFVNGAITTNGGGLVTLGVSQISDGTKTTASSSITDLNSFAAATYRSAKYEVSISDSTNSRYALHTVVVTHDGTNAYINDTVVSSTGSSMATFTADISAGSVRVRIVPISSDSTTYKFVRIAINV